MGFSWEGALHCLTVWRNPPLKAIGFSDNRLNDDDAILIAAALESNTKLRHLVLCGNVNITSRGWDALRPALWDDTNLNSVSGSNHACRVVSADPKIVLCRTTLLH